MNLRLSHLSSAIHLALMIVLVSARTFDEALSLLSYLIKYNGIIILLDALFVVDYNLPVCDALVHICIQVESSKDAYL